MQNKNMLDITISSLKRRKIILCALVIIATSSIWYLAQWPGAITHDGLYLIDETSKGIYYSYHPIINGLLVRFLIVPFDSIGIYTLLQTAFCTGVLIWIVASLIQKNTPFWVIVILTLVVSFSIPVAAYRSMVWKDIPASFGVLIAFYLIFKVATENDFFAKNKYFLIIYVLATCLISLFRHGWQINLILFPFFIAAACRITGNRIYLRIIFTGPIVGAILLIILMLLVPVSNDRTHEGNLKIQALMQPFLGVLNYPDGHISPNPSKEHRIVSTLFDDEGILKYSPTHTHPVLSSFKSDAGEKISGGDLVYMVEVCIVNLTACLSDRITMFLGTLHPAAPRYGMTYYNLGVHQDCEKIFARKPEYCSLLKEYASPPELLQSLNLNFQKIIAWSNNISQPYPKLWIWTSLPFFLLLLTGVSISRWFPATSLASLFLLTQCLVPFATSMANDFRYLFFVYLCGLFLIPMLLCELKQRSVRKGVSVIT